MSDFVYATPNGVSKSKNDQFKEGAIQAAMYSAAVFFTIVSFGIGVTLGLVIPGGVDNVLGTDRQGTPLILLPLILGGGLEVTAIILFSKAAARFEEERARKKAERNQ